jgi:hypothetical protein
MSPCGVLAHHLVPNGSANKPLTNDRIRARNLASDLLFHVGVAGFEPTASSSRTGHEHS